MYKYIMTALIILLTLAAVSARGPAIHVSVGTSGSITNPTIHYGSASYYDNTGSTRGSYGIVKTRDGDIYGGYHRVYGSGRQESGSFGVSTIYGDDGSTHQALSSASMRNQYVRGSVYRDSRNSYSGSVYAGATNINRPYYYAGSNSYPAYVPRPSIYSGYDVTGSSFR
jgi:hypothetical protein